jgi:hypothetical protein
MRAMKHHAPPYRALVGGIVAALMWCGVALAGNPPAFVGPGGFAAQDANGFVVGNLYPTGAITRSTIIPGLHLPHLIASATPTVCVTGDSTSTTSANNLASTDLLYYNLTRRIREDFPTKTISFVNLAIGGQTWTTLNSIPSAFLPFYFSVQFPWLAYIQGANCTSLFINMGINDANSLVATQVQQVLAKIVAFGNTPAAWPGATQSVALRTIIKDSNGLLQIAGQAGTTGSSAPTWSTAPVGVNTTDGSVIWQLLSANAYVPSIPDIVLITNKNGNFFSTAPFNTALNQAGTIAAASYVRTLALSGGAGMNITGLPPIGLIDIGRRFTEVYNGYDPAAQVFTAAIPAASPISGITAFPYTLPVTPGGDFDLSFTLGSGSSYTNDTYIQVADGNPGTTAGTLVSIEGNGATTTVSLNNATATQNVFTQTNSWLAGSNTIRITAKGEHVLVQVNGAVVLDTLTARFVSSFQPVIQFAGTAPSSPTMTINAYNVGTPVRYAPSVTAVQCFGTTDGTNGNGLNHDNSACINAVDVPVLEATRFAP